MNLKILLMLLIYWSTFIAIFAVGGDTILQDQFSINADLNSTALGLEETSTLGGIFGSGLSFGRWFGLASFGLGLVGAPSWFQLIFAIWQTIVTIFTVGFIISSIWNG